MVVQLKVKSVAMTISSNHLACISQVLPMEILWVEYSGIMTGFSSWMGCVDMSVLSSWLDYRLVQNAKVSSKSTWIHQRWFWHNCTKCWPNRCFLSAHVSFHERQYPCTLSDCCAESKSSYAYQDRPIYPALLTSCLLFCKLHCKCRICRQLFIMSNQQQAWILPCVWCSITCRIVFQLVPRAQQWAIICRILEKGATSPTWLLLLCSEG